VALKQHSQARQALASQLVCCKPTVQLTLLKGQCYPAEGRMFSCSPEKEKRHLFVTSEAL
jgi:hypothetical protein